MLSKIYNGSLHIIRILTVLIFVTMTVIVFSQVVFRYVFDSSIFWAEEFARYSMIWITFLGAATGVSLGEHTRIDFFVKKLPPLLYKYVEFLNRLLCIVFLGFIVFYSVNMLGNTINMTSPAMKVPLGFVHLILPFTGVLMIFYLSIEAYNILGNKKEGIIES